MFLLIDMEDLQPELRALGFADATGYRKETPKVQLLEASAADGSTSHTGTTSRPNPMVVAQALTRLDEMGDVPPAGINIPETGQ